MYAPQGIRANDLLQRCRCTISVLIRSALTACTTEAEQAICRVCGARSMAQEGVKFLYNALPALGGAAAPSQDAEPTSMPFRDDAVTLDAAELDALASNSRVAVEHALNDTCCRCIANNYKMWPHLHWR